MIGPGGTGNKISVELDSQGTTLDNIKTNQTDGSQKSQIVDSSGNNLNVDSTTNCLVVISTEHNEIHEGDHYNIAGFTTLNADVSADFSVLVSSDVAPHMVFAIEGTSRTEMYIYEGADCDADGTPVTPINNNRNSSNTSSMTVQENPTVNSLGTLIYSQSSGLEGDNKIGAKTGIILRADEIILKYSKKYLFRIKSKDDGNIISYKCSCYENGS